MAPGLLGLAAISAGGSLISAGMKGRVAKEQQKRAVELRKEAQNAYKHKIRNEYLQTLRASQFDTTRNMPGYQTAKEGIEGGTANAIKASMASGSGVDTMGSLSYLYQGELAAKRGLNAQNSGYKQATRDVTKNMMLRIGDEQKQLERLQDIEKSRLEGQADNLEYAATSNRITAVDDSISTVTSLANLGLMKKLNPEGGYQPLPEGGASEKTTGVSMAPSEFGLRSKLSGQNQAILNKDYNTATSIEIMELKRYLNSLGMSVPINGILDLATQQALNSLRTK